LLRSPWRCGSGRLGLAVSIGSGVGLTIAAIAGVIVTAVIRVLAVVFDLSLPEQRMLYRRRVAAETGALKEPTTQIPGRPASDFMVDVLKKMNIDCCYSNPASSFRALHESMINYGKNTKPEFLTAPHEEGKEGMGEGMGEGKEPGQKPGKGKGKGKSQEKNEPMGKGDRIADGKVSNGASSGNKVTGDGNFEYLPPRQRELIRQAMSGNLPPEYAAYIQQYYINVARGRPASQQK